MTNIDLCGIARLLRTLVAQKKTTEREARRILARIAAQTVRTLSFLSEIALFSIAISKVLWYCLCCKKGGDLTWRKS